MAVVEEVSVDLTDAGFGNGWNPEVIVGGRSEAGDEVTVLFWSEMRVGADADASELKLE